MRISDWSSDVCSSDLADIGVVLHVDEVDDDKTGHIPKLQLAGNFAGSLQIGSHGSLLDPVLAGRPSRVDVNRHQRFGRIDDQVAARFQLHHWMIHGGKLIFHAMTLEQRNRIGILLYPPRMAGHQQFHEVLGCLIAILALDQHFLRSEEHTSELQSLMRISYAVFCLKKKNKKNQNRTLQ